LKNIRFKLLASVFCLISFLSSNLLAKDDPVIFSVKVLVGGIVTDSVSCFRRGETYYSSIKTLILLSGGSIVSKNNTLSLTFPGNSVVFIIGSPFGKLADGTIYQLPMPVEIIDENCFLETQSLVKLLNSISSTQISFDPKIPAFSINEAVNLPGKLEDRSRWALDLVVIDPGHGGKDPGAVGAAGLKEKDVTLDVGIRLNKFLQNKNIKTVLTRDSDEFIALSERTSIANNAKGKLFISLHCNASKQRKANGMETYFLAPTKTERATQVALLENEAIRFEDARDRYKELTEESYILMTMTQATFTAESESLAGMLQDTITKKIGLTNRGVDQAGFYVLIGASMPAILFEMGFISNKDEEKKLKDKKFRQRLAEEIGGVIVEFLADQEKTPGQ